MNVIIMAIIGATVFLVAAPFLGGTLTGIDRKLTARMQSRRGPPITQPFYDFSKLWHKEKIVTNPIETIFATAYLVFIAVSGALLFAGLNILLVVFCLVLAHTFIILAAYAANAPYSHIGAERELLSTMVAEPVMILIAGGLFMVTGTFTVSEIFFNTSLPAVCYLPGVFLTLFAVITLKLRKSPFDISTSHHAHQEIIKGVTSSFAGKTLAKVELAHWYELIILLGFIILFFGNMPIFGIIVALVAFFLEIVIDNVFPRITWQMTVKSLWLITLILGVLNTIIIGMLMAGGIII